MTSEKILMLVLLVSAGYAPLRGQTPGANFGHGDSSVPLRLVFASSSERGLESPRTASAGRYSHVGGTVVVGGALSDGLVLAADSRMVATGSGAASYKIVSDAADKIYDLDSDAIATYGEAFVLGRDIGSYIQDFGLQLQKAPVRDVQELAKKFSQYFGSFYDQQTQKDKTSPEVGFLVAGYGSDGVGRIIQIDFPSRREPSELHNTRTNPGLAWMGQTDVISRLIKGVDPLLASLPVMGQLTTAQQQELNSEIPRLEYGVPYQYLMLQDGVDLSMFLVQATVDAQRFSFGTVGWPGAIPGVGGPVDVVAITPFKLEWIKRKQLTAR